MAAGDGAPVTVTVNRSVEKALEEAAATGALKLSSRKLREFPRSARNYDLSDITHADLSKNRLCDLPEELCNFISLETLSLYHNAMRSLTPGLGNLQALTYLNLSRNLLPRLPPSVFQLPLLRVLIVSNNKMRSLPSEIAALAHLRQLDASCNELQLLPGELGHLDALRDLNLRRNRIRNLPEEISELPLVRLDVSCNQITHVPLCYRRLRHLQVLLLDNNPLQLPPAQICTRGKYHIFKYLNVEACRRSQEERPIGFNSSFSDQELFPGLDSGFNSVDSGSKRWSGNESADQRNLEEEEDQEEAAPGPGGAQHAAPGPVLGLVDRGLDLTENSSPPLNLDTTMCRSPEDPGASSLASSSSCASSCASSSPQEERRRPETLLLWQERERAQQQRDKSSFLKATSPKTATDATSPFPRGDNVQEPSPVSPSVLLQRSSSRTDPPKTSPPFQKPNSFLFRSTSRSNVKPSGSGGELRADVVRLRKTLESRLQTNLPDDLLDALSNGIVLCQLANQIRPRSVAIIHVPSPAVPKLSAAKCRLNVENFISACRKLGVPEADVCSSSQVLLGNGGAVLRCVTALLLVAAATAEAPPPPGDPPSSLLSTDFLLFYAVAMATLYAVYCYLIG